MMYPVPFEPRHLLALRLQPAQAGVDVRDIAPLLTGPHSSTLMLDGRPMICAGAATLSAERALVWSFVGADVRAPMFREVHGWAKRFVAGLPYRRLEATCRTGFGAGHRWLRALGFSIFDAGPQEALYALVREG